MTGARNKIVEAIESYSAGKHEEHWFYFIEPWSVQQRSPEVIAQALRDDVDLREPHFASIVGKDPHPFQDGFLLSNKPFRYMVAGTSLGKSFGAMIDITIQVTGEIPFSLRYDAGVDTGIKRRIDKNNIIRFGRRDSQTGEIIDYNWRHARAGAAIDWDCGTIIGVGKYPEEKICPPGQHIWIGTYQKALQEYWWPNFCSDRSIIPPHCINKKLGNKGFAKQENTIHTNDGRAIVIITFESGYRRFEAYRAHSVFLDEEPQDQAIVTAARGHCETSLSMQMTPYNGISYTYEPIYGGPDPDRDVFHAIAYDSPYMTDEMIRVNRKQWADWEIKARVYGIHAEQEGRPYFDRDKVNTWIRRQRSLPPPKLARFVPNSEFFGMVQMYGISELPGLMDIGVRMEDSHKKDLRDVWEIYEDLKPNVPYLLTADSAEGAEDPQSAGDNAAALITRPQEGDPDPVIVASLESTLPANDFALVCAYGARYYNNALMAAETRRHFANATFFAEIKDYPYWYKHTSLNDATRTSQSKPGFDLAPSVRSSVFDCIDRWVRSREEKPDIPWMLLLVEIAGCIVGKKGRPDHKKRTGSLDAAVTFGEALWIFKNAREQIRFNGVSVAPRRPPDRGQKPKEELDIMPDFGYAEPSNPLEVARYV